MVRAGFISALITIIMITCPMSFTAQVREKGKCEFSFGADIVSTYVWRGSYQAGTSIQPAVDFTIGGFSVGAWGSVEAAGFDYKEVDLTVSYSFHNITIGFFDYWVGGERNYNYFDFSKTTPHLIEINLLYDFGRFPLTLGWNTIVAGDEMYTQYEKNGKFKKSFPTYLEATYTIPFQEINLDFTMGVSSWQSSTMYNRFDEGGRNNGFAVINMCFKASKEIKITESYALSCYGQLIINPAKEDAFFVFGFTLMVGRFSL